MRRVLSPLARALAGAGAALSLSAVSPAAAQDVEQPAGRASLEIPVTLDRIPRLVVTLKGQVLLDETRPDRPLDAGGPALPGLRGPGCPVNVASHTNANFQGGSYILQAGFAEDEVLAASYVLPAAAFPAKFESAEAIFATSGATVSTTTHWSILIYDGPPSGGTLLYQESSLEGILPPVQMGPGTNGVLVQVVIDPSDPEQVFFLNPNGTNTISVGFRIDEHHNQTSNPCFTAPPTSSNAFPVVDVSGLGAPGGNWLFGLNCGAFGCPPNGGWTTFGSLSLLCRPSGDWVMRMSWSSVNCEPVTGACCLPNGTCEVRLSTECQQAQGVFQGDGTTCEGINCPAPTGACCFPDTGFCLSLPEGDCLNAGGSWAGAGTVCGANNTCPTGACCLPSGECEVMTSGQCTAAGGLFRGVGVACAQANCPQPSGACCLSNGFCLVLTAAECAGIPGVWQGAGTACSTPNICDPDCPVDWNEDSLINSSDISAFLSGWLLSLQNGTLDADFNGDNAVNSSDISSFLTEWLNAVQNGC